MGLFDIFSSSDANNAAQAQTQGYQQGYNQLGQLYGQAGNALQSNYLGGLQPVANNLNNANAGTNALGNALGLNGPQGSAAAVQAFQANPGYQFGLNQGLNAVQARQQQMGQGASGNAMLALNDYAQNYANQNWQQYLQNLQPYQNQATQNAALNLQGYGQLGQGLSNLYSGQGNAAYGSAVGQGNAQAQADYANLNASQNLWNLFGNVAGAGLKVAAAG